ENIKVALPVQLGLLVQPPGGGGHNVVVDGYNTDDYYHFNFGWGGSANGWYTLPPTSIPYNLTVIEGAVLDIWPKNYTGYPREKEKQNVRLFPNPASTEITVCSEMGEGELILYNLTGRQLEVYHLQQPTTGISVASLPAGIYFVSILKNGMQVFSGKIVKQ
ncbi:MAG: T9SS type A sorting domain-containing protein, partial [Bacteroidales bacterium]|nr:T9SS type A sorting domain-containing protein [Bacteroidales bacterium]